MVAAVEPAHRDHLDRHADQQRRDQREQRASDEAAGQRGERGGEIGADHVERAVRQIDQIHDAEHERQPGGEQEQQQPELQAVQALFDEQQHGRSDAAPRADESTSAETDDAASQVRPARPPSVV